MNIGGAGGNLPASGLQALRALAATSSARRNPAPAPRPAGSLFNNPIQKHKKPTRGFLCFWWRMEPKSTPGYKPELDEPGLADSTAQQAASKHGLHVTPAVHNHINNDFVVSNTVDHSVRLEEGLPVFFDTQAD